MDAADQILICRRTPCQPPSMLPGTGSGRIVETTLCARSPMQAKQWGGEPVQAKNAVFYNQHFMILWIPRSFQKKGTGLGGDFFYRSILAVKSGTPWWLWKYAFHFCGCEKERFGGQTITFTPILTHHVIFARASHATSQNNKFKDDKDTEDRKN